jgi:hypothetical protein
MAGRAMATAQGLTPTPRYGTYIVEFKTAADETLAISIPGSEAAVIRYFQEPMPYGLLVSDVPWRKLIPTLTNTDSPCPA